MNTSADTHRKLLKDYTRSIVHMRHQVNLKRLGLIFCAGLSKPFNSPNWSELVDRISKDSNVKGNSTLRFTERVSLSYKTELLFQHFRKLQAEKYDGENINSLAFENKTLAKWMGICAKHLYKNSPRNFKKMLEHHPYLSNFVPIIQETPLTVTYNFDDYLERALSENKRTDDKSRGFETVTNPWMQFRRTTGVVYHPNGIIPSLLMELPRDRFIFSESSFVKQQIGATRDISFLVNHFSKNTCLIIGSSLEDETLRTVLAQSAEINPGNCHYYVHFLSDNKKISQQDLDVTSRANFNVFNLITLFLDNAGIAALAQLINPKCINDNEFSDLADDNKIQLQYHFYLTGALGVGKSTIANQFRNLIVLDEWHKSRPKILAKPWDTLTKKEKTAADTWIAEEFQLKNDRLRHEKSGIFVVDRPPLDPLAFTPTKELRSKAKLLLDTICPAEGREVADGVIIFLKGEPAELSVRLLATGRGDYTSRRLQKMQEALTKIYQCSGVIILDTCGMSIADVTKQVSEIIHFREYKTCSLDAQLRSFL